MVNECVMGYRKYDVSQLWRNSAWGEKMVNGKSICDMLYNSYAAKLQQKDQRDHSCQLGKVLTN